ncbi:MAG TPA: YtxH domain-containing protein [Polyangiaceae bacterium]|nr:YtxH domain-containing protein [Polyangiaceae bacterium]
MSNILTDALCWAGLMSRPRSWISPFALGAATGVVAGAAVAAMLTPMNGREMRDRVGEKAKGLADRTQSALAEVTSAVKEGVERAPEMLSQAKASIKEHMPESAHRNHTPNRGA